MYVISGSCEDGNVETGGIVGAALRFPMAVGGISGSVIVLGSVAGSIGGEGVC